MPELRAAGDCGTQTLIGVNGVTHGSKGDDQQLVRDLVADGLDVMQLVDVLRGVDHQIDDICHHLGSILVQPGPVVL